MKMMNEFDDGEDENEDEGEYEWRYILETYMGRWKVKMNDKMKGGTWNGNSIGTMKNEDEWENIWSWNDVMVEMVDGWKKI